MKPLNVWDYRELARRRLPRGVFEYVDRGTEDEVGLAELRKRLNAIKLNQFVLNDISSPDTTVSLLGSELAAPIIIAPTAAAGLMWHDGEVHLARAAGRHRIPFCVATQSMTSMEEIAERAPDTELWFQLYVFEDRELTYSLMRRARALGIGTLLFTVDTARNPPKKEWNTRNGYGIPITPSLVGALDLMAHPRWTLSVLLRYLLTSGIPTYRHYPDEFRTKITRASVADNVRLSARLTWEDLADIRRRWEGNLIVKGILTREDAQEACRLGADGVVISSHGGRNFDSAPAAIDIIPEVADAVGKRMTILADSGIRRGSDIVKYLASGAQAVLVGRATLYGTAVAGEAGAAGVLQVLREELDHCLAFSGQPGIAAISRKLLRNHPPPGCCRRAGDIGRETVGQEGESA